MDDYFCKRYTVEHASAREQRREIDRKFTNPLTGTAISVEYKTDIQADSTNNAVIEIIANDDCLTFGWGVRCDADWLIYYIDTLNWDTCRLLVVPVRTLHAKVESWIAKYGRRAIVSPNEYYRTWSIKLPLDLLRYEAMNKAYWHLEQGPPLLHSLDSGLGRSFVNQETASMPSAFARYTYKPARGTYDAAVGRWIIDTSRGPQEESVALAYYRADGWNFLGALHPWRQAHSIYVFRQLSALQDPGP